MPFILNHFMSIAPDDRPVPLSATLLRDGGSNVITRSRLLRTVLDKINELKPKRADSRIGFLDSLIFAFPLYTFVVRRSKFLYLLTVSGQSNRQNERGKKEIMN